MWTFSQMRIWRGRRLKIWIQEYKEEYKWDKTQFLTHRRGSGSRHATRQRWGKGGWYYFSLKVFNPSWSVIQWPLPPGLAPFWAWWTGAVRAAVTASAIKEEFSSKGRRAEALLNSITCFLTAIIFPWWEGRNKNTVIREYPVIMHPLISTVPSFIRGLPRSFSRSKAKGSERVVWHPTAEQTRPEHKLLKCNEKILKKRDRDVRHSQRKHQPDCFSGSSAITADTEPLGARTQYNNRIPN